MGSVARPKPGPAGVPAYRARVPEPGEPPVDPAEDRPDQLSPVPFVVALVGFVIVAVLAFVFLRADDEGRLVRPDRLDVVDDDTIRVVAAGEPACLTVDRAQVDLGEGTVHVELVVTGEGDCDDAADVVAEITLPEPVGDRTLLAGVGRLRLPCTGEGSTVSCEPAG